LTRPSASGLRPNPRWARVAVSLRFTNPLRGFSSPPSDRIFGGFALKLAERGGLTRPAASGLRPNPRCAQVAVSLRFTNPLRGFSSPPSDRIFGGFALKLAERGGLTRPSASGLRPNPRWARVAVSLRFTNPLRGFSSPPSDRIFGGFALKLAERGGLTRPAASGLRPNPRWARVAVSLRFTNPLRGFSSPPSDRIFGGFALKLAERGGLTRPSASGLRPNPRCARVAVSLRFTNPLRGFSSPPSDRIFGGFALKLAERGGFEPPVPF
jgi:hypothetical protein